MLYKALFITMGMTPSPNSVGFSTLTPPFIHEARQLQQERRTKSTYLACQVEIRMVGQIDWCGLTGLSSVVDDKLSTIQGVCHPDF
jgi:hypothetical protein